MCQSCKQLRINGVVTHETGCPDAWKDYTRTCKCCGQEFKPIERYQECCEHTCWVAYSGVDCDCELCRVEDESINQAAELSGEYHGE